MISFFKQETKGRHKVCTAVHRCQATIPILFNTHFKLPHPLDGSERYITIHAYPIPIKFTHIYWIIIVLHPNLISSVEGVRATSISHNTLVFNVRRSFITRSIIYLLSFYLFLICLDDIIGLVLCKMSIKDIRSWWQIL